MNDTVSELIERSGLLGSEPRAAGLHIPVDAGVAAAFLL
jgi:hypothetical protein